MKTKPNFTYKEFIQKISHVNLSHKNDPQTKSPKALKTQNKNAPTFSAINYDRVLEKKSLNREGSLSNSPNPKKSGRKVQMKQNTAEQISKNISKPVQTIKSTTTKKLQLKNHSKPPYHQATKGSKTNHCKSIYQNSRGNFYHNQPSFIDERHNESCSTFYRISQLQNDQDRLHNQSTSEIKKSPSQQSKLTYKKHSTSSIDAKVKIASKGNLTERNMQRVNTQYYQEVRRPDQRVNTQYNQEKKRLSPSFYKLSVDESSFLDLQQDKMHKNLFPQSCTLRCNKSTISLTSNNNQQKVKLNEKSHQHIYNKFISKISQTLFLITKIDNQLKLLQHKIKYIQFLECLKQLKMIKSDYEPYSQTDSLDLVKELWEQLVLGQNISHFIIIVALILKITPLQHIKSDPSFELQNYIYIQKKYEQFRFTRLQLDKSKLYSQKQSMDYYNFPFKPTISKTSEQIVSKSRSQRKYKINASVNNHNASANNHNQSIRTNSKQQNISINNEFQNSNQSIVQFPNQNSILNENQSLMQNRHQNSMLRSTSPLGNKRSDILYKQGKKKSLQKRQDKSTVDYEYQKNKQQLTFKPKLIIKRKKSKPNQSSSNQYISPRFAMDEQKAINRLIRGRVQKEVKYKVIGKGLPYNDKLIQKLMKQKYEEIIKTHNESKMKGSYGQNQIKGYSGQNQTVVKLNESKLEKSEAKMNQLNQSKVKINSSQVHHKSRDDNIVHSHNKDDTSINNRCTTQIQHLQSIHNLSFQDCQNLDNEHLTNQQNLTDKIQTSPPKAPKFSYPKPQLSDSQIEQPDQYYSDQFFSLDIYYQQDKSDKLLIRRDSSFQEIIEQTQKFVQKHNLSKQMGNKLKQELMIAMKYHDVQKIQENAQQDECSLLA